MMRDDPEGMRAATAVFGPAREAAFAVATAVSAGGWNRAAALRVEASVGARALRDPGFWVSWARYHVSGDRHCPMLPVLRSGRRLPSDIDAWLEVARRSHGS
jgi:hypothetical protein